MTSDDEPEEIDEFAASDFVARPGGLATIVADVWIPEICEPYVRERITEHFGKRMRRGRWLFKALLWLKVYREETVGLGFPVNTFVRCLRGSDPCRSICERVAMDLYLEIQHRRPKRVVMLPGPLPASSCDALRVAFKVRIGYR